MVVKMAGALWRLGALILVYRQIHIKGLIIKPIAH
jgi:hypothetical protein